ncbi:putative gas vesicle synthesis protein, GvpF/L-like [Bradyrhizobium sp. ORS 375]|uniref:GvpL/GvpF family gas vesicle protein n=1 Tax=Bradyrhizobium sp. (strain ORS 375) TaxID=566679 RepID=UPI00024058EB|nr:GvpL/GvpF family gas vesicle protein [Bradyrhizobium sp. ORS 375]CCD94535.1 putative gas vesicle synthesis protein, GvpF/L-like [Bradyrhizobium sp. ORS 375]
MSSQSIYVYGLIRAEDHHPIAARAVGDPEQPVTILSSGNIAALVSAIDLPEIMPTRRHMLAHTQVLEAAMAHGPVLPMRFGVIVPNPATLLRVIGFRRQELRARLDEIDGRIEVALKASWDEQFMWRQLAAAHPQLANNGRAMIGRGEQQTYYDRIELGRAIGAALEDRRTAARQQLLQTVTPFAIQVKELAPIDDAMFAHFALLVDRTSEQALYRVVEQLEQNDAGLKFRYVAPIPPYNFVSVTLDWDQHDAAPAPGHGR